jgi:hypothetical protein
MNQNLLYILIFAVFIYIVLDNSKETFYEKFMPQDPSHYIDSCRRLSQEQKKVKDLEKVVCNKNINSMGISRRDPINSNINCYNLGEKEIMLENEKPSWCSKITPEQLSLIEKELGTKVIPIDAKSSPLELYPSPLFIENDFKNSSAYDPITPNFSSY